jgi:O-antigen/teichoic acid export membrane protein
LILKDHRYRAAAATAAASVLGRPVNMLLSMVAVALAVRAVGHEAYGVLVMCITATTWLAALDCGLSSSTINRIVRARGDGGGTAVRGVVSTAFFFLAAVGIVVAVAMGWATYFTGLPDFLNQGDSLPRWQVQGCLAAFAVFVACWFPAQIFERASVAYQEGWLPVVGQLAGNTVGLGLLAAATVVAPLLPWAAGAWVAGTCAGAVAIAVVALLRHPGAFLPAWRFASRAELGRLMGAGSWFILIGLAGQVGLQSDALIAGMATNALDAGDGAAVAAEVAIPMRLFNAVNAFAILAINPLWPAYVEAAAKGDAAWLRRTLWKSMLIAVAASSLVVLPCVVFGQEILRLWVGEEVRVPTSFLVAGGAWTVTMTLCQSMNVFLNGLGFLRFQFALNLLFLILVVPAKIIALRQFGPTGMIAATAVVCMLTQVIPYLVFIQRWAMAHVERRGTRPAGAVVA